MIEGDVKVSTPDERSRLGFFQTIVIMFRNSWGSRELIWQLFRRDFLMAYKKSFFGMAWIIVTPIVGIISWVIFNATGILQPGDVGIPYPAYVLLSSSIWGVFMGFYGAAGGTLGAGGGIIMQVNYPHEALLFKQAMQFLIGFVITLVVNLVFLLLFGVTPSWMIVLFPIIALPLFFLGSAIGLIISVISIVGPDVSKIFNTVFGFLFYITPVIYAPETSSELLQTLIKYNPLTYLIGAARDSLIYGKIDNLGIYLALFIGSLLLFLISLRMFYVSEHKAVEKMI